jgi:hypothetical protein
MAMDPYVPAPRRRRTRRWAALPVILALAAVLAYSEHDRGPASTLAGVDSTVNPKVVHAAAVKLEAKCAEANLLSCLENEPSAASPSPIPLGAYGPVTVQDYAEAYYDSAPGDVTAATRNLQDAGVQAIVHEKWTTPGRDRAQADVIVMRFASAQGARARALAGDGSSLSAQGSDGLGVAIPGLPGHVYPQRTPNGEGLVNAAYFEAVGNLLMIVQFASAGSFDQTDFASWALGEYLTLRTARIPAAPVTMIGAATTSCSPLSACLDSAPASDAVDDTGGWDGYSSPTLAEFVQQMYPYSYAATATAQLTGQGLTDIAHAAWQDAAGDQVDVVLLRFKTVQGAESRAREEIGGIDGPKFGVSGPGSAEGTYTATADSAGSYDADVYGYVGDVAVEVHAFTVEPKDLSEATSAAQRQFAELAAVTTTSTVPQPALVVPSTAPSTLGGTSSCADILSCLVPLPSGATARSSTSYDKSTEVTVAQFVADKFAAGSVRSFEAGLMTSSGVRQIVHRSWFGAQGDQADVSVLVFANAAQAQAGAMNYQGAVGQSGRLFSVAGYSDAVGSVDTTVESDGYTHAEIVAYTANFEVRMDCYSLGDFNARDAISWFDAQMAELPRG